MNPTDVASFRGDELVYVQVRERLRNRLSQMKEGDRLPSQRKLAEDMNIACMTLRRAMSDLEREGFVIRQHGRGTFVARISQQASKPAELSHTVIVVAPGLEISHHVDILKGAEAEVVRRGCKLWLRNARYSGQEEMAILEEVAAENATGLITQPHPDNVLNPRYIKLLQSITRAGKNVVLMDQYVPGVDCRVVMFDKFKAGYMSAEHMIMSGHRRIGIVSSHTFDTSGNEIYRGFRSALKDYDITFDGRLEINLPVMNSAVPAGNAIRALLNEDPDICTALFCAQFSMVYGVYGVLRQMGISIGSDFLLVGDDTQQNPETISIPAIDSPWKEMGRFAVELLLTQVSEESPKKHVLLSPKLVIPSVSA